MDTNKELTDRLRKMGCKSAFKPFLDTESETILLAVRRTAEITGGRLVGTMIDLYDPETFRVWTPHTKKAKGAAESYSLTIRDLDGECELFIPAHLADALLREFGAKVKRTLSKEHKAKLKAFGFKKYTQESTSYCLSCHRGS